MREIACLLTIVRAQYLAAAAECDRLSAVRPDHQPGAGEDADHVAAALSVLREKLKHIESALASAQQRNRDLQARIAVLEAERASPGSSPSGSSDGPAALHPDLARVRATSASVQDDMASLLRFLDELTSILPAAPGSPPSG